MKLGLIGVGLIGGSAAAAWRAGGIRQVIGYDRDAQALRRAHAHGLIDTVAASAAEVARAADLVLLAVPVLALPEVLREIAPALPAQTLVTDVGSTKVSVIEAARAALGAAFARFVPAHPIAGRELPGVDHADPQLFAGKLVITTPVAETDRAACARVEHLWISAGARIVPMDPHEHDRVFAAVSHLPHLLAFALVAAIAAEPDGAHKLGFAGAGFRDFTRIAASSPEVWRDICIANRTALSAELRRYRALLDHLQAAVDGADAPLLERTFAAAAAARRQLTTWEGE
ncbi:MAG: prephenate dehydrogenase/arogenate dehydrogenase family protein [Sutterellaceae bacterium]|nr:prephenate dehydrogenase/arogenate dehydrogenase family protein [Burkholderiaceae bacterium]MCX7901216.1 prephenate dehydrogenase/arogenate dehydrogenase family protein [Burkholderiaceae bacterium]MDW8430808.1 prephenate dehydrogenase/arogenate dehydrogenase family protein [Sutterellaceae bacterium]